MGNIDQNNGEDIEQSDGESIEKNDEKDIEQNGGENIEQNDGENIGNLKIEHNNERVNGYNDIVDKIPQNTKTDEEVNGKNWTNEYGKKSEEPFSNYVIGDKHVCFKFNKLYKVAKRVNDMAWRCVHELPRLYFNKNLISKF